MDITETYIKPAEDATRVVGCICDRCGERLPEDGSYRRRDFDLLFQEGDVYPEGGDLEGWEVEDACDECVAFLRKLLADNGFTIRVVDRSW